MRSIIAAAIALLVASAVTLVAQAGFQTVSYTVTIDSAELGVGGEATVELSIVEIGGDLPLGGWTIDVTYDPDIVDIAGCSAYANSVCNEHLQEGRSRVEGASAKGLTKDTTVADITFRCIAEGTSELSIWAGSGGIPEIIFDITTEDGEVICQTTPTPTAAPPTPPELPNTGSRAATPHSFVSVAMPTALALAAFALLVASWRLRTRR